MALKLNYPIGKRDKLLERKFYLGDNVDERQTALKEMEELVEQKIFTEIQMKLPKLRKLLDDMRNSADKSIESKPLDDMFENKQTVE